MKTIMSSVDDENSSTSTSSSSATMAKPVFLRASMLRPSAFSAQTLSSFKPAPEAVAEVSAPPEPAQDTARETVVDMEPKEKSKAEQEPQKKEATEKPADDPLALLTKSNGLAKSNPFTAVQVTPLTSSSGFVFGQNVRDRVTGSNVDDEASSSNGDLSFSTTAGAPQSSSGTDEQGGNAEAAVDKDKEDATSSGKSLSEVAAEYEENKNARKRKFEEVETFTGEEDEINVLDVTCKLYTFSQVYEERGRGSLRLNDPKQGTDSASRLVFRTAGSLRVLLNTKIWDGMIAEPASPKSLRITAIDSTGQVKVYLVMARPSDIQGLAMALKMRIVAEKTRVAKVSDEDGGVDTKRTMDSVTNGTWDEEEEKSTVTPDLIADAEKKNDGDVEEDDDDEDLEHLCVEVPAFKKRALDPDSPEDDVKETSATEKTPAANDTETQPQETSQMAN